MSDLITEGAVAGHMNHIYDNGQMTFGELKELLRAAAAGELEGTEKTDGQNIFLSFDVSRQSALAARNKGHIKYGGLTPEELNSFFKDHPNQALRASFVEASITFEKRIKELAPETQENIFGSNGEIYYNIEVMNPNTTNVIGYDKKTLLIHRVGHGSFDKATGKKRDININDNFDKLENALGDAAKNLEVTADNFSVETNPIRRLPAIKNKEIYSNTLSRLNDLMSDINSADRDTINDYVIKQTVPLIDQLNVDDTIKKQILLRVMDMEDPDLGVKPSITSITKGMPPNLKQDISKFVKEFNYSSFTLQLQRVLHDFSVAMIDGLESSFINDNQAEIQNLQNQARDTIQKIQKSNNEAAKQALKMQLYKLKDVANINTPSEGFVFDFNGATYKFTGSFAPANQILGMIKFNRFGPIEAETESEPTFRVALVPGAFKPPHRGHLKMVESFWSINKIDKVIVLISNPLKRSRTLPSGKVITAEHAKLIWENYIAGSNLTGTEVVISNQPSPLKAVLDFIGGDIDPNNLNIAPQNSEVYLGCGDKDEDSSRYDSVNKYKREDVSVKIVACPLNEKHSSSYMSILNSNEEIKNEIPSMVDGSKDPEDFHASDMRYLAEKAVANVTAREMFSDFTPSDDALAVMGILGLNPVDTPDDEDVYTEIIFKIADEIIAENYQKNMKSTLHGEMSWFLDQGRKDLTKYGGGYHLDRPKGKSNAFLAKEGAEDEDEENLEELSSMGGGTVEGPAAGSAGSFVGFTDDDNEEEKTNTQRKQD